jgi:tetratricopeptide (TPR) repeat protein
MPAKPRPSTKRTVPAGDIIPDQSAMSAFVKRLGRAAAERATDAAQQLMFDAWEADSPAKALALARKALATSPLCSDAMVFLAPVLAASPQDEVDLFDRAVMAGSLALGPKSFAEMAGHFWGFVETRPYMRARHHLVLALITAGRSADAVRHCEEMLRLNPNDNQGIRYIMLDELIRLGRLDDAGALVKRYRGDGSAHWLYDVALLAFRTKGETAATRKALAKARAQNPHAPGFLLGRKRLPKRSPAFVGWGDRDEAIAYAQDAGALWGASPAALDWLRRAEDGPERGTGE